MSLINLSVKHGEAPETARANFRQAIVDVQGKLAAFVERVEWGDDHTRARMVGKGFDLELWVDDQDVHAVGNVAILGPLLSNPLAGKLLSGPFSSNLKGILQQAFQKRLT